MYLTAISIKQIYLAVVTTLCQFNSMLVKNIQLPIKHILNCLFHSQSKDWFLYHDYCLINQKNM